MSKTTNFFKNFIPISIVIAIFLIFSVMSGGKTLAPKNLSDVLQQSFSVIIGGFGMIFVMSMGSIDMSMGSIVLIGGIVSIMTASPFGVVPMFIVCILIGAGFGLMNGLVISYFKVPSFMVTIGLSFALKGLGNFLIQNAGEVLVMPKETRAFDTLEYKLIIIIVLAFIAIFLFEYTKFGQRCKAIGENELASQMSGINTRRVKVLAFVLSGAFAGMAAMFIMARTGGASNTVGSGFEMRILLALFLGGVPVLGGFDTKMYRVLIGALAVLFLENGMALTGITGGMYQLLEGVALLIVIILTTFIQKKAVMSDEVAMAKAKISDSSES